jgi:hypothetical protein
MRLGIGWPATSWHEPLGLDSVDFNIDQEILPQIYSLGMTANLDVQKLSKLLHRKIGYQKLSEANPRL